jgi:hypothetical protein
MSDMIYTRVSGLIILYYTYRKACIECRVYSLIMQNNSTTHRFCSAGVRYSVAAVISAAVQLAAVV